ncbi:hypothetical protein [Halobacterium zhouii]|uniref:hypothetical protein n=1 Tax=Halobacterium zhouii TaxID=2902624 RepID=UPI001E37E9E3|nr:hypothetical protein [Halobacterium zhouii]
MQIEPLTDEDNDVPPCRYRPEFGNTHHIVFIYNEDFRPAHAYKSTEKRDAEQEAFLALRDTDPRKTGDIEIIPRDDYTEMHHPDGTYAVIHHPRGAV